jgi:putative PIN family toxin of toxin-antitoxin system
MAVTEPIRLVLDVNWLVSASISAGSRQKFEALLLDGRFMFCVCAELLEEFDTVMARPAFRKKVRREDLLAFRDIFVERSIVVKLGQVSRRVRDIKDDYLVALCEKTAAHFLITGDSDLLVLKKVGRTEIVTMVEFREQYF